MFVCLYLQHQLQRHFHRSKKQINLWEAQLDDQYYLQYVSLSSCVFAHYLWCHHFWSAMHQIHKCEHSWFLQSVFLGYCASIFNITLWRNKILRMLRILSKTMAPNLLFFQFFSTTQVEIVESYWFDERVISSKIKPWCVDGRKVIRGGVVAV